MERIRYEIDPHNRLAARISGRRGRIKAFRRVMDGAFKVGGNNELSYHVKSPIPDGTDIPHQVKFRGNWSLTPNHDLRITLDKLGRETFGDQVTLRGDIIGVGAHSLAFAVKTKSKDGKDTTYILDLEGSWKADEANRLTFHAKKEDGASDILTFGGAWEVNRDHQIIYRYEKSFRSRKKVHSLEFKGHWDIKDAARMSYIVGGRTDSVFDFAVSAGIFKERYIKYEVGISLAKRIRPVSRVVKLSGKWNLKRGAGLIFEIDHGGGRVSAITFGAEAKLTARDTISFRLKDGIKNMDLGASLELAHEILEGDGESFVELLMSKGECAIYAGGAWRW